MSGAQPEGETTEMTLCMVWRKEGNVCFASDSRLSFDKVRCDAGFKVSRIPFSICSIGKPPVSGDLGMAFSGSSIAALMTKEALAEVVREVKGVEEIHDLSMDALADLVFRGFKVITRNIAVALLERVATCVVFGGYCMREKRIRVFRMEVDGANNHSIHEVLKAVGDLEVFGSGEPAARRNLPTSSPGTQEILYALRAVIEDETIQEVGGHIQFGHFVDSNFQVAGIAEPFDNHKRIHYWRGPIDLNGDEFNRETGLVPQIPQLLL
jgi:hypothetical protein